MSLIPLQVRFGSEEFSDGVNLSHRQFFEKLIESAELPQTSQINEFRWGELFEKNPKRKSSYRGYYIFQTFGYVFLR